MTKNKRKCLLCFDPKQAEKYMNGWHDCPDKNLEPEQRWGKKKTKKNNYV